MQILHGIDGLRQSPRGAALTIGNFDGLHLGHRHILSTCCQHKTSGLASAAVVVTFEPHPLTVLRPKAVEPRLTTAAMKQGLIAEMGIDALVILPPEPAVLNLTAEDFLAILRDDVKPAFMMEGPDFTFGKARRGNVAMLEKWAADSGVQFQLAEPLTRPLLDFKVVRISSSLIRWLVAGGRMRDAAICLGRPYALRGEVTHGFGRGKGLGTPTVNLNCGDQLIPGDGVYAGRCRVGEAIYPAAISIGNLPTFGDSPRQIEAYLLGFSGDLYGTTLDLEFLDWLREQRKFPTPDSLVSQIELDVVQTRRRSRMDPSVPIAS